MSALDEKQHRCFAWKAILSPDRQLASNRGRRRPYGPPLPPSIPGTKRVSRVEENTAADQLGLSAEQIERLNNLTSAVGERHEVAQMATMTAEHDDHDPPGSDYL